MPSIAAALPRVALFADQFVGCEVLLFLLNNHPEHLRYVVVDSDNEIAALARQSGCSIVRYDLLSSDTVEQHLGALDFIFLAWWPKIVPSWILNLPAVGVINLHPSLLPHDRGKHYNFWTIVDETPFGVTLHFATEQIDAGDILFQSAIEKTWEDNGGSLYAKALQASIELFKSRYLDIVGGRYTRTPQRSSSCKTHYARELDSASEIVLGKSYTARCLLNLLRARTFPGKPACYFYDAKKKYEVRISINEACDDRN